MGKAKDIVRITLRSSPSMKPQENPKVIYDILRQHFSEVTYSCMPMADFYRTVPVTGETPIEYWLRLNKAVDIAEEGLKRLGRQMENPCQEATMMFVKYCPDPALAAVLKFKAPDKWTTSEIQERIDHYQIERKEQVLSKPKCPRSVTVHAQTPAPDDSATVRHTVESPVETVEDFEIFQGTSQPEKDKQEKKYDNAEPAELKQRLQRVGLADIDIEKCHADQVGKEKLVELLEQYNDIFSKHALDCGEAKDFVHRIRLTDEKPFRLPYRRVPPVHYQKLRQVLSEMEEQEIIRKSVSEYASPLVLVWKKDGSLRLCTDFRWLNARTLKDAHPLPHQSDCLAALGGNTYFSTMDLTSGFYNIPMAEEDKKYTAFTTPMGLYEYNRMPQGLCNSPASASFMRMMLSIFGDLNFSHLLCYLDDLLVFAATQEEALKRLEVVFQQAKTP
ncbi:hypothetical protein L3Q82_005963 [Scortum barcoo]|uniref:Uncharacterized protein n=1 Tax=Scortum barcoo TaxID=214431 RepID=A0ACB8X2T2_9TELE|nr:hypothetical protein L3Q82_005963 [Scortum barcoo]